MTSAATLLLSLSSQSQRASLPHFSPPVSLPHLHPLEDQLPPPIWHVAENVPHLSPAAMGFLHSHMYHPLSTHSVFDTRLARERIWFVSVNSRLSLVQQVVAGVGTRRGSYSMQSMAHPFSKQCDGGKLQKKKEWTRQAPQNRATQLLNKMLPLASSFLSIKSLEALGKLQHSTAGQGACIAVPSLNKRTTSNLEVLAVNNHGNSPPPPALEDGAKPIAFPLSSPTHRNTSNSLPHAQLTATPLHRSTQNS